MTRLIPLTIGSRSNKSTLVINTLKILQKLTDGLLLMRPIFKLRLTTS